MKSDKVGEIMSKLLVIEGLDGSGKATQAKLLYDALCSCGAKVRQVSFPDYQSESSALIKMYLNGEFGDKPGDVNAYAASTFFAVDRYASFMKDWRDDYHKGIIIADRYTTSNAIHQCSKLSALEWNTYLDWLFDFEYRKMRIPEPDLVIYLRVDPEVSQQLMTKRYGGYEEKKDIHEKDREYLRRCQEAASYCTKKLGWQVIDCCSEGNMLPVEAIGNDVFLLVKDYLQM